MARLLGVALLPAALGCGRVVEPLQLRVTIEAQKTAAATGESIGFVVDAEGERLLSIAINFGDGVTDQVVIRSARTAAAVFEHAFTEAGVYTVRATALDAVSGSKETSVEVRIN